MKLFNHHTSIRRVVPISIALLSLFGATAVSASQPDESKSSCRQEMRRVAIWPHGPKAPTFARFDYREVTVCDGKAVAGRKLDAPQPEQGRS